MKSPKLFIGPMSKNIVDSVIEISNEYNVKIGLIPSRRQVEYDGGYVNKWTSHNFCNYVREKSNNILLVRDHSGPDQGNENDDGIFSFISDCKLFDIIHVDVWKKYKNYDEGLKKTIEFIKLGYSLNPELLYEVGTEESIRKFESYEINKFIYDLKNNLPTNIFKKIIYCVVQSGTSLRGVENTGIYNSKNLIDMVEITKKYNIISKEHNGDFLDELLISEKFKMGLQSINIAPEFGHIETETILKEIEEFQPHLFDDFFNICLKSGKWKKWVNSEFNPYNNKRELIKITGHYVFSDNEFIDLKLKLSTNIDSKIKTNIKAKILSMIKTIDNNHEILLIEYFKKFSNKDLDGLSELLSEDVKLKDWEIQATTKKEVLTSSQKIFESVKNLEVVVNNFYQKNNSFACDITIIINNTDRINVIDLISFDSNNKIKEINAYKQ